MIELFEQNERKADRQSSKGNQLKWENNGIWYKADCTGYEGLAEYMISHLLKFSSLQKDEFVLYDYERIKYKNIFYNGVKSNNFLYDDWQIITLERLFHNFFQKSLYEAVWLYNLHFSFTKKDVEQILNEIPGYSDQEKERVRDILFEQMRKYKWLFKN